MRLWVLSDLHVELTRGWDLPSGKARPSFDVLVVAGDLIPRMERGVRWLLERVPDKAVVYVPGNHEFYGTDIDRTVEKAMEAAEGTNVFVLQDRSIRLGDVTFAGTTLWTDFALLGDEHRAMTVAADQMNDYKKIRVGRYVERFRPPHALLRHRKSRTFVIDEMKKPRGITGRLVVVTHHAPIPSWGRLVAPLRPGAKLTDDEVLEAAYRSDLTALMWPASIAADGDRRPADLWIYGHTHESEDVMIGSVRVVSNGKGYGPWLPMHRTWDNRHFDPNFVIDI